MHSLRIGDARSTLLKSLNVYCFNVVIKDESLTWSAVTASIILLWFV